MHTPSPSLATLARLLAVGLLLPVSLANPPARAAESTRSARWANTVVLDETGVRNLRLRTEEVSEEVFEQTFFALGRIDVRPGHQAALSSRIPGRAIAVHAQLDHFVTAGEPLVTVESRLPGDPPPTVTLPAPREGIVSEVSVVLGGPVNPDTSLLQILDLSVVYALARVPQHVGERLRPGLKARLRIPGWKDGEWTARLEHIGALADAASSTMEAAFHVDNPALRLRPGMRVEFNIVLEERPGVTVVPRSALQGDPASRFLYVADDTLPHAFVKVPVEIGEMNDRVVEITRGLFPGDRVVTEGAYSLAFASTGTLSLKEALDAAHGHEHNPDGSEPGQAPNSAAGEHADHQHAGHDHDHEHEQAQKPQGPWSALTLASLAGNVILLALLAALGRRVAATPTSPAPPSH
ncbi:MAG: efflux RND transporter periplasmic adaptor subunit [Verrucomicrobiales bacterium]|nr:efflux RND transporter periplasmic adaptor subunit [Verrucomicrobiales bacterium]